MSARNWRIGGVASAVLVLLLSWFLLVSPTLDKASALEAEAVSEQQASEALLSRISLLKKQSEELPAQEALLASIQQRMPSTAALPTLIRNLTTVAEAANVTVATVTPGKPTPVTQPTPPAPPPPVEGEEQDAADSEGDSTDVADGTAAVAAPAVPAGPQVEAMTLNITACGTFAQLRNYLRELEQMKRVVAVSGLQMSKGSCAEGSAEDDLTASVSAHVFTLPAPVPTEVPADTAATEGDENE